MLDANIARNGMSIISSSIPNRIPIKNRQNSLAIDGDRGKYERDNQPNCAWANSLALSKDQKVENFWIYINFNMSYTIEKVQIQFSEGQKCSVHKKIYFVVNLLNFWQLLTISYSR